MSAAEVSRWFTVNVSSSPGLAMAVISSTFVNETSWLFSADVTPGESMCPAWAAVAVTRVLSISPATLL